MNGSYVFVLLIITVVMVTSVIKTWLKQKQSTSDEPNLELEETLSKIDHLEERIKVLERIITENRFDLKSEIDSL